MTASPSVRDWVADRIPLLAQASGVWLVGGAVRDSLLGRPVGDLDFAVLGEARSLGRKVADHLGAAYYELDRTRDAGRVVWSQADGQRRTLDFAALRAPDIEHDLTARDFTVNALAIPLLGPLRVLDPTGGAQDLRRKVLRMCRETSIEEDPIRSLRGVRLASELDLTIEPATVGRMRRDGPLLARVAPERVRDELFRVFSSRHPSRAGRVLSHLGLLQASLPEFSIPPRRPAHSPSDGDDWEHSLRVVGRLEGILEILGVVPNSNEAQDITLAQVSGRLGSDRAMIQEHLGHELVAGRTARQLLMFVALGHRGEGTDPHGPAHPDAADQPAVVRAAWRLSLSREEAERAERIVRAIPWPEAFESGPPIPPRAMYHFLRKVGKAAPEVALLMLADSLARQVEPPPETLWVGQLESAHAVLQAAGVDRHRWLNARPLVRGDVLAQELGVPPGPAIGRALEAILEAQVAGEIHTSAEAIALARRVLADPVPAADRERLRARGAGQG